MKQIARKVQGSMSRTASFIASQLVPQNRASGASRKNPWRGNCSDAGAVVVWAGGANVVPHGRVDNVGFPALSRVIGGDDSSEIA